MYPFIKKLLYYTCVCALFFSCSDDHAPKSVYYTVSFEVPEGIETAPIKVRKGECVPELPTPTIDYYAFEHWCSDSLLTEEFGATTPIVEDITLYGKWSQEVIQIEDIDDLVAFRDLINSGSTSFDAVLRQDLDLSSIPNWEPIGSDADVAYTGHFDGNGHTLLNLQIDRESGKYIGFFGYAQDALIENFTLEEPRIVGGVYVGAICGATEGDNAIHRCQVLGGSIVADAGVGGIVGYNNNQTGEIADCYNSARVTGLSNVGGIAGMSSTSLVGCINEGSIYGEFETSVYAPHNVGGVVGFLSGPNPMVVLERCVNLGSVMSEVPQTGGVAGFSIEGVFINCSNYGSVLSSREYTGGIVGNNSQTKKTISLSGCKNIGSVEGTQFVGGITGGIQQNSVEGCYNAGNVVGTLCVGGIAGEIYYEGSQLLTCYNTGLISGEGAVGGIVGSDKGALSTGDQESGIHACYNTGAIRCSVATTGTIAGESNQAESITACYYVSAAGCDADHGIGGGSENHGIAPLESVFALNQLNIITVMNAVGGEHYQYELGQIIPTIVKR